MKCLVKPQNLFKNQTAKFACIMGNVSRYANNKNIILKFQN